MPNMSDFLESKIIDHLLRGQAYSPPGTIYLALYTTATTDGGGGTEVTGGSYARQIVALAASGGAGMTTSTGDVTWTNMPAVTITHVAIKDAATVGNHLMHGPLSSPKTVAAGDDFTIRAADLDLTFD